MIVGLEGFMSLFMTLACLEYFQLPSGASTLRLMPIENQSETPVCNENEFQCASDHCIPLRYVCDKHEDCRGGFDENPETCENFTLVEPQIAGGKAAKQEDYPWHVGIYWIEPKKSGGHRHEFKCGGTLVAVATVLTAAHCGHDAQFDKWVPPSKMAVAAGKSKSSWDEDDEGITQKRSVLRFVGHKNYVGRDGNFNFDIALIILSMPVRVSFNVLPIRINFSEQRLQGGTKGKVVGWGKSEEGVQISPDLLYAEIPLIERKECRSKLKGVHLRQALTFDKYCGGFHTEGPTIQRGDSGGGLVYEENGKHYVGGIVSTALTVSNFWISFYTDVASHQEWIEQQMDSKRLRQIPCRVRASRFWARNVAVFKIRHIDSGKFLAVEGMSTKPGANIIPTEDDGARDKLWRFSIDSIFLPTIGVTRIMNLHSELFLWAKDPTGNLTRLHQEKHESSSISWEVDYSDSTTNVVRLRYREKFTDRNRSDFDGNMLIRADEVLLERRDLKLLPKPEARWSLEPSGTDWDDVCSERRTSSVFKIRNEHSGKLLSVDGSSTEEGAAIVLWEDTGRLDQLWYLETNSTWSWMIRNVNSNKGLHMFVRFYSQSSDEHDSFDLRDNGNGLFHIKFYISCLQVANISMENGAKVVRMVPDDNDQSRCQHWSFLPVDISLVHRALEDKKILKT